MIGTNLAEVREAMARAAKRCGRDPGSIRLVAVSKLKPAALIREAFAAGQVDFGENYAQELRDKMAELSNITARWHFIGHLQKNKVKYVAGKTALIHSVDSLDLAAEIGKRSRDAASKVLIEVNLGGEESKSGCEPGVAIGIVRAARKIEGVSVEGLMTMPPLYDDAERTRPFFRRLRELRDEAREALGDPRALPELSMGLSHDFETAIEEGATIIRVGTAIFGARE